MKLLPLLLIILASEGVCFNEICVRSGEMVALLCPKESGQRGNVTWRTPQETDLTSSTSSTDQNGVLLYDESLVILSASASQQGNYSCSQGNSNKTFWFELTVYTTLPRGCENRTQYREQDCVREQSCTLYCPASNTPPKNMTSLTSQGITWEKDGKTLSREHTYHFTSVEESDKGIYTCTRPYLYHSQIYNMTFTVKLDVKPKEPMKNERIIEPRPDQVFLVDLGSPLVINCTAVIYSEFDEVYWLYDHSDTTYTASSVKTKEGTQMTAHLGFKQISKEDLSTVFTCKLESVSQPSISVNVTLSQRERHSYTGVTVCSVVAIGVMIITVVIYIQYKIHITLFIRDTLGCQRRSSDGKSYDACVMYYESNACAGLSEHDAKTLENTLEEQFGYSLCLFHRNVLPGRAVADAVLECVDQSRTVVLVPAFPDLRTESGLLSAIHEALVERQTRLVLIKTKSTETMGAGSLSEILQLLGKVGHSVTWKGPPAPSSFFWKHLRYYLPPVHAPRISLVPQTVTV